MFPHCYWGSYESSLARVVKNLTMQEMQEMQVQFLGQGGVLEEEMATHSSILAWRIPWTGSLVGHGPQGRQVSDMTEVT